MGGFRRGAVTASVALALALIVGCAAPDQLGRGIAPPTTSDSNTVDYGGLPGVRIGQTLAELTAAGRMASSTEEACGPRLADLTTVSPVFDHDRLVLLWAYPPWHTPEGIAVGSPLADVRRAYAGALDLEQRPNTFAGLLVPDRHGNAYLILYDDDRVQKLIVGMEEYARLLYTRGFGTC